jgi:hypothetical protein
MQEAQEKIEAADKSLEEEKAGLFHELSRGKVEAIKLLQVMVL